MIEVLKQIHMSIGQFFVFVFVLVFVFVFVFVLALVIAGDESPVEDDTDLEADPDVHQAVEDNQAGEGKLKSTKMFAGAEE